MTVMTIIAKALSSTFLALILLVEPFTGSPSIQGDTGIDGSKQTIQQLIDKLRSDDDEIRQDAAASLIKTWDDSIRVLLLEALNKEQGYARAYAARVLIEADPNNPPPISVLIEIMMKTTEGRDVRRFASYVLALVPAGVGALVIALKHEDVFVRRSAAFALEELIEIRHVLGMELLVPVKASLPALLAATKDSDDIVKGVAMDALVPLPDEMKELASQTRDKEEKTAAEIVLKTGKKQSHKAGVGYDVDLKDDRFQEVVKGGKFLEGTLGIIRAKAMGGGPVKDYRSLPLPDLSLHFVVNTRTRKGWSGVNRFNAYADLK